MGIADLNKIRKCCTKVFDLTALEGKYLFLHLSSATSVLIDDIQEENDLRILYRSHMKSELSGQKSFFRFINKVHTQIYKQIYLGKKSFFRFIDKVHTQIDKQVCTSRYGIHPERPK